MKGVGKVIEVELEDEEKSYEGHHPIYKKKTMMRNSPTNEIAFEKLWCKRKVLKNKPSHSISSAKNTEKNK